MPGLARAHPPTASYNLTYPLRIPLIATSRTQKGKTNHVD